MPSSQEPETLSIPKQGSNPYLDVVTRKMHEKGISPAQLSKWIGVNPITLLTKEGGFPRDPKEQGPFTKITVARFQMNLGIPPETFLLKKEDEEKWFLEQERNDIKIKRDKYFTHSYWNEVKGLRSYVPSIRSVDYFNYRDHNAANELVECYKRISPYFRNAQKSISAHELLFKGDNRNEEIYYEYAQAQINIHKAILEALEVNTTHPDFERRLFKYDRVFYLSRSERVFKKREGDRDQCLMAFISESSIETLQHVRYCLENYRFNCRFRVADVKSYRHHVIIDSQMVLTEDYVVSNNSVRVERLSIMDIHLADLGEKYERMISGHAEESDFTFEITSDLIDFYFNELIDYLRSQLDKFEIAKEVIQENKSDLSVLIEPLLLRIKTLKFMLSANIDKREKYHSGKI